MPRFQYPRAWDGKPERRVKHKAFCRWYLLCVRPATTTIAHPLRGDVAACAECAAKIKRLSA